MDKLEEKLDEISIEISQKQGEVYKDLSDVWKSIRTIIDVIKDTNNKINELRTDVDKLIENNGGKSYGRTA